jgi:hypothetical protein
MRTALYEGHLDRGCSAYGACERNIVALSIRNRGNSCLGGQGCGYPGDFQGVSSKVSQYNIWDEFLTQISGLTSCFLREDLSGEGVRSTAEAPLDFNADYYKKIRAMYEQNVEEVERILFGDDRDLAKVFPGTPLGDLKRLRHYYHPPAMGKCFPEPRVEYMSGAVASRGDDFALIANTRIRCGEGARRDVGGRQLPGLRSRREEGEPRQFQELPSLRRIAQLRLQKYPPLPQDSALVAQGEGAGGAM